MAKEIFPSSYKCDCGYECHFFESTIEEMKKMSKKKQVRLCDSEDAEHTIVFVRGKAKDAKGFRDSPNPDSGRVKKNRGSVTS